MEIILTSVTKGRFIARFSAGFHFGQIQVPRHQSLIYEHLELEHSDSEREGEREMEREREGV